MAKTTKLAAVNRILSNIGQSPVVNLISGNPMVEMAELILNEVTGAIQSEGWVFNYEYSFPFYPNADGIIEIPDNVIQIDTNGLIDENLVIREGKLYDKLRHSFIFDRERELDVLWEFEFEDLPEAFREYATIRAANVFAGRSVGSQEAVAFGQREEVLARATAIEYDTQQGDYNIFQNKDGYNTRPTYRPLNTMLRY